MRSLCGRVGFRLSAAGAHCLHGALRVPAIRNDNACDPGDTAVDPQRAQLTRALHQLARLSTLRFCSWYLLFYLFTF